MRFIIILSVLLGLLGSAVMAEPRLALVIGNKDYPNGGLFSSLTNPLNDAQDMKAMLERYHFEVVSLVLNGNKQKIDNAVQTFINQLPAEGTALLYYSGHGIEVRGENYLIPVGTTFRNADDVYRDAVNAHDILRKIGLSKKRVNIFILDMCLEDLNESKGFEGKGLAKKDLDESKGFESKGLADMNATGVIVSYATTHGERSYGNRGKRNSVYTGSLLEVLNQGGNLPIEQVFKEARAAVVDVTDFIQRPVTWTGLIGNFCFGICDSVSKPPISPAVPPPVVITPIKPVPIEAVHVGISKSTKDDCSYFYKPNGVLCCRKPNGVTTCDNPSGEEACPHYFYKPSGVLCCRRPSGDMCE